MKSRRASWILVALVVAGGLWLLHAASRDGGSSTNLGPGKVDADRDDPTLDTTGVKGRRTEGAPRAVPAVLHATVEPGDAVDAAVHVRFGDDVTVHDVVDGRVRIERTLAGVVLARVWATASRGRAAPARDARLAAGEETRVTLVLDRAILRGTVVSARGTPLAGAAVRAAGSGPQDRILATTNAAGEFTYPLEGSELPEALVAYDRLHHASDPQPVRFDRPMHFELLPRLRIRGRVRVAGGGSPAGARVHVSVISRPGAVVPERRDDDPFEARQGWMREMRRGAPETSRTRVDMEIVVGEDGLFELALPFDGDTSGRVRLTGYASTTFDIATGDHHDGLREVLLERGGMEGARLTVVDGGGRPLRRVRVYVQDLARGVEQRLYLDTHTDDRGTIDLSTLRRGEDVMVTVSPNPDDPKADRPALRAGLRWTVEPGAQLVWK